MKRETVESVIEIESELLRRRRQERAWRIKMWEAIIPAITAIVGSVVGMLSQMVAERVNSKQTWLRTCGEYRIREYFSCIDAYSDLRVSFSEIGAATSGRKKLEGCLSEDEENEMKVRDRRAASAIDQCWNSLNAAQKATNRLYSIGADRALEDYIVIDRLINGYFVDAYHTAMEKDGLFVTRRHREALAELDGCIDDLISHARTDLKMVG